MTLINNRAKKKVQTEKKVDLEWRFVFRNRKRCNNNNKKIIKNKLTGNDDNNEAKKKIDCQRTKTKKKLKIR